MSSNKILITGGSGLLAINWAFQNKDKYDFILGLHNRLLSIPIGLSAKQLNLNSVNKIKDDLSAIKPDLVIHTVANTNVEYCEANPGIAREVNVVLAANVAKACSDFSIPLIHISTDHLFSGREPFADENCVVEPLNVYGKTKAEAENIVLDLHKDALVIRTNFFGWGTTYRKSFSDFIISALREDRDIELFNDVYFTPILISNLVAAAHELVDRGKSGIFNIVGNERLSKYEFGCRLADAFDLSSQLIKPSSINDKPELIIRPKDMSLSNIKLTETLNRPLDSINTDFSNLLVSESFMSLIGI